MTPEKKIIFRTRFAGHKKVSLACPPTSRTKQEFKDECDINVIMKRFNKTGQLPEMIRDNPAYGDFSDSVDFQEALNLVNHANEQFQALPAKIRERFGNDPANFLEFATDKNNLQEMVSMGLAEKIAPDPLKTQKNTIPEAGKGKKGDRPVPPPPAEDQE